VEEGRRGRVINPLHDPGRDDVKQGKTWGQMGGEGTIKEGQGVRGRYIRVVMTAATATATRRAMQEERYTKWRTYAI